jgi:hypothetical protein
VLFRSSPNRDSNCSNSSPEAPSAVLAILSRFFNLYHSTGLHLMALQEQPVKYGNGQSVFKKFTSRGSALSFVATFGSSRCHIVLRNHDPNGRFRQTPPFGPRWGSPGNGDPHPVDVGDSGAHLANLHLVTAPGPTSIRSGRSIRRHRTAHSVAVGGSGSSRLERLRRRHRSDVGPDMTEVNECFAV